MIEHVGSGPFLSFGASGLPGGCHSQNVHPALRVAFSVCRVRLALSHSVFSFACFVLACFVCNDFRCLPPSRQSRDHELSTPLLSRVHFYTVLSRAASLLSPPGVRRGGLRRGLVRRRATLIELPCVGLIKLLMPKPKPQPEPQVVQPVQGSIQGAVVPAGQ